MAESIKNSEVAFIAVGTPPGEDGSSDLQYALPVAREIGENMNDYGVIVTKSTVPVGTAEKVRNAIQDVLDKRNVAIEFDVASNPEFLKEGAAITDFMKPDRIVLGISSERAKKVLEKLYHPFTLNGHPLVFMDIPSAEMTKYAANAMLATKISFMNDIANLCEIIGADVNLVCAGIGSDPRIGNKFIYPGIGYSGSCFSKDVKALIRTAREHGHEMRILQSIEDVNEDQKSVLFKKVKKRFGDLSGKHFAMWGLSFKPNTDDMREAPSVVIIEQPIAEGATVTDYDPVVMKEAKHRVGDKIAYAENEFDALNEADALLVVTEWSEFKSPDFRDLKSTLKNNLIFDGRNIFDKDEMIRQGIENYCIGLQS